MVKQCGPKLALLIPDARAERTKPQVGTHAREVSIKLTSRNLCCANTWQTRLIESYGLRAARLL